MKISILGPMELTGPRGPIRLTARRQQIVLAILVWNANRVVPIDTLIDALWESSPPATARSQVHISVSGTRKRLGRAGLQQLVSTEPPGYLVRLADGELDLHHFEVLVSQARAELAGGRTGEAGELFAEALRLWRGQPFTGMDSNRVATIAAQLTERRVSVSEEYFDLRIALGQSAEVIGELLELVEVYPFRERLRAQLMVALYRTGRQVEALREYRDMRGMLVDELGIEPGWELRRLEQDILAGSVRMSQQPGGYAPVKHPVHSPERPPARASSAPIGK